MRQDIVRQDAFSTSFLDVPLGIAIAITDPLGRFQACNSAYCDILGYTKAELQCIDWRYVTHPVDRERNSDLMNQLFRREISNFEIEKRYRNKAVDTIWCRVHLSIRTASPRMKQTRCAH